MNKRPRDLGAPQFGGRDSRFRHPSLCPRDCGDTSRGLANNPVVPEPLMGCAIFIRSHRDELSFAVVRTGFGPPNPCPVRSYRASSSRMGISRGCAGHRFRNRLPSVLHRMQISSVTRPLPRLSSRRVNAPAPSVAPPWRRFFPPKLARIYDDTLYWVWPLRDYCRASRLRGLLKLPQLLTGQPGVADRPPAGPNDVTRALNLRADQLVLLAITAAPPPFELKRRALVLTSLQRREDGK
jgi:hypothetical protein